MIVSLNWLKTLISFDHSPDDLSNLLTNTGLEVEKLEEKSSVPGGLRGLVVGEVLTCKAHPNADRLSVTTVQISDDKVVQIVCGAPNVAAGQKVIVAPVGCTLYPMGQEPFEIKKAKIRGETSEGMICAEDEIGLGSNHDGILILPQDCEVGMPATKYFPVEEDYQIEIGLTPNRGDATSHLGVARDIRAVTGTEIMVPKVSTPTGGLPQTVTVDLPHPVLCPRYTGIVLKDITVGESPDWLKLRLRSIGLNSINNVVDITNYVLHEIGQPIHAFDADTIEGTVQVRPSKKGEKFTTLDGVERNLTGEELLIADDKKALALAGVFGGLASGVKESTTRVFVESAYFNPSAIRKSAKAQGLSTDASFRYERGCDPEITVYALHRVVDLLKETCGATVESSVLDVYPLPISPVEVDLSVNWLNNFCGTNITKKEVISILQRLDILTQEGNQDLIHTTIPPYRYDVTRPVDLAEEVLRIYGYNKVENPSQLSFTPSVKDDKSHSEFEKQLAQYLNGIGFLEIMNNSQNREEDTGETSVPMLNPLSAELSHMRTSMVPGMLTAIRYNQNRKNKDLQFYEFGKIYFKKGEKFIEPRRLMLATTGDTKSTNWIQKNEASDYFYLKGVVEGLAKVLNIKQKDIFKSVELSEMDRRSAKKFDVKNQVWFADIDLDKLHNFWLKSKFTLEDVPVFPIVDRDLSIVLNQDVPFAQVLSIIRQSCGNLLRDVEVFDVYTGDRIDEDKKAYACSIALYDPTQTLTDKTVNTAINKVIKQLETQLEATIRK